MIEFDLRFDFELNQHEYKYVIRTYEGSCTQIPIIDDEDQILRKLEINLLNENFSKTNVVKLLKTNKNVQKFDFVSILIRPEDILTVKGYAALLFRFDMSIKQNIRKGPLRDILYEHKKYLEISFSDFLKEPEVFLNNLQKIFEITKGKNLIFTSGAKKFSEMKGFAEKFSLVMACVLNSKNKFAVKPIYKNQIDMENYHLKIFYEIIKQSVVKNCVVMNDQKISRILIKDVLETKFAD